MEFKTFVSSLWVMALTLNPTAIAQSSPTLKPCTVSGFIGPDQQLELNFMGDEAGNLVSIPFLLTYYFDLDKDENKAEIKGFTPIEGQPHVMLVSFFGAIDKTSKDIEYTNLTTRVVGYEKVTAQTRLFASRMETSAAELVSLEPPFLDDERTQMYTAILSARPTDFPDVTSDVNQKQKLHEYAVDFFVADLENQKNFTLQFAGLSGEIISAQLSPSQIDHSANEKQLIAKVERSLPVIGKVCSLVKE